MRVLSGMQPSGNLHLGNYFGSVKPNIDLLGNDENFYIIVDLHALTSISDPKKLRSYRLEMVKDMLACGFDPKHGILFLQSDVQEHAELLWILSCVTPMGLIERAVSYKDKIAKGIESNVGLFTYPVLQAADILLYDVDVVPVGKDQKQHIEIARDIAQKFNNRFGEGILKLPEPKIREEVAVVPGIDGQKMSKSYGNTIPIFSDEKAIKKAIMGIVTDSKSVEDPKDPKDCIIYQLHELLLDGVEKEKLAAQYFAGGFGYGDAKKMFLKSYLQYFVSMREKRASISDKEALRVIKYGAKKARSIAVKTMERVRVAVGLR